MPAPRITTERPLPLDGGKRKILRTRRRWDCEPQRLHRQIGCARPADRSDMLEQIASCQCHSTRPLASSRAERQTDSNSRSEAHKFYGRAHPLAASRVVQSNHPHQREQTHGRHNSREISTLNTLIATTIDSITGYENSAKNIDDERFREVFRQRADERQKVVEELRSRSASPGRRSRRGRLLPRQGPSALRRSEGGHHRRATKSRSSTRSSVARIISRRNSKRRCKREPERRNSRSRGALLPVGQPGHDQISQ